VDDCATNEKGGRINRIARYDYRRVVMVWSYK